MEPAEAGTVRHMAEFVPGSATSGEQPMSTEARQRWRLVIRRVADAPAQTAAEWQAAWERALAASGLPVSWTGSRQPKPRFVPALPLAPGMPADRELADLVLAERMPRWVVRGAIERVVPAGHALVDCHDVWVGEPSLPGQVAAAEYEVRLAAPLPDEARVVAAVAETLAAGRLIRVRVRGDRRVEYDLRPLILGLLLVRDVATAAGSSVPGTPVVVEPRAEDGARRGQGGLILRMRLRHDPERGPGRPDEVLREIGERAGIGMAPVSITRTRVLLAADLAAANEAVPDRHVSEAEDE